MTGARMGEVLALKVEDIDLVNKRICFSKIFEAASNKVVSRTKGKRNRYVGLNKNITSVVEEFLKLHTRPPSAYLISEDGKAPVGPRSIRRMHDRVIKKGKLKTITPHDLRHTYASHFVMNGGNLMILKEILGHTAYETTLRYAHLAPGHLESQASIVNFDTTDVATADENASEERLKNVIDFTRKS